MKRRVLAVCREIQFGLFVTAALGALFLSACSSSGHSSNTSGSTTPVTISQEEAFCNGVASAIDGMIKYNNAQTFLSASNVGDPDAQSPLYAQSVAMETFAQNSQLTDTEIAAFKVLQGCNQEFGNGYPSSQFINSTYIEAQQAGW